MENIKSNPTEILQNDDLPSFTGKKPDIKTEVILLLLLFLLQLSFHSVAVVLTLVTNKNKYT